MTTTTRRRPMRDEAKTEPTDSEIDYLVGRIILRACRDHGDHGSRWEKFQNLEREIEKIGAGVPERVGKKARSALEYQLLDPNGSFQKIFRSRMVKRLEEQIRKEVDEKVAQATAALVDRVVESMTEEQQETIVNAVARRLLEDESNGPVVRGLRKATGRFVGSRLVFVGPDEEAES
jgi:hypothetical protein